MSVQYDSGSLERLPSPGLDQSPLKGRPLLLSRGNSSTMAQSGPGSPDSQGSYYDQQSCRRWGQRGNDRDIPVSSQPGAESPKFFPNSDGERLFSKSWNLRGSPRSTPVTPQPSIDIPKTFPSVDADQLFTRTWALRRSHRDSSEEISPGTSPAASHLVSQRKTRKSDSRFSSDTSNSPTSHSSEFPRPSIRRNGPSSLLEVDTKPLKSQLSSDSIISHKSSSTMKSETSTRTRETNEVREVGDLSRPRKGKRPSRKPKPGYKWYRGIGGTWREMKTRIKDLSEGDVDEIPTIQVSTDSTVVPKQPGYQSGADTLSNQGNLASPSSRPNLPCLPSESYFAASANTLTVPKEGLYIRTKRRLGFKKPIKQSSSHQLVDKRTLTGDLLYQASRVLDERARRITTTPSASSSTSDLSIAGEFHRQPTGSWKRTSFLDSSVDDMFGERTPCSSPNPEAFYTGSDKQQYFTVEMSHPDAPSFLPSEARRVGTPPLPHSSPVNCGHTRGFFFDYNAPGDHGSSLSGGVQRSPSAVKPSLADDGESTWFRTAVMHCKRAGWKDEFELNVPEHLPNSPLCPRHPKHSSGGKGVCVYHGRNAGSKGAL